VASNSARIVANVLYALAVGGAAGSLAIAGPFVVAFVAEWIFNRLGWIQPRDLAARVPSYFAVLVVFGVAVGLTTCLRVLGQRFRKEAEPRSLR
jgi:hypothetical protein